MTREDIKEFQHRISMHAAEKLVNRGSENNNEEVVNFVLDKNQFMKEWRKKGGFDRLINLK